MSEEVPANDFFVPGLVFKSLWNQGYVCFAVFSQPEPPAFLRRQRRLSC